MPEVRFPVQRSRQEIAAAALGLVAEPFAATVATNAAAPTSQSVFGQLVGLRAGDVVTGAVLMMQVAAVGTAPTTARFGLADSTGKMLVQSGNVGAAASWPVGFAQFPFASTYTVPSDGGYYVCFVVNGTWGTTQPTPSESGALTAGMLGSVGSGPPRQFLWAGQTDLPANGASLTITTPGTRPYWVAVY